MPKRVGGLYQQFITLSNWKLAQERAFKNKKRFESVKRYLAKGDGYTEKLRRDFIKGRFILRGYNTKKIYEPKERILYIARLEERVFHWAAMQLIEPIFEPTFHYHSYSCRKGKGQHKGSLANAEAVRKYKYVIDVDASKFYPSIPHELLKKDISRKIKDTKFLEATIFKIIDSHHTPGRQDYGVPIGNYSSQIFGNIYMTKFDKFCCTLKGAKRVLRYCDNSLIFFNDKELAKKAREEIKKFYTQVLDMQMSKLELYPTSQGVDFVGYRSFKHKVLLRKRTVKRMRKTIQVLLKKRERKQISSLKAMSTVASVIGWAIHAKTSTFRKTLQLDTLLQEFKNELRLAA